MSFWRNLTTGKDNQTHDIVRVAMVSVTVTLLVTLILGAAMYLYGYIASLNNPNIKPFDIQTFFDATSTQGAAIGAFLMSGAASLFFKKTTEPNGSVTETESVTKGAQPDKVTVINPPL